MLCENRIQNMQDYNNNYVIKQIYNRKYIMKWLQVYEESKELDSGSLTLLF